MGLLWVWDSEAVLLYISVEARHRGQIDAYIYRVSLSHTLSKVISTT
jgi:hypothetical protein